MSAALQPQAALKLDRPALIFKGAKPFILGQNAVCMWGEFRIHNLVVAQVTWGLLGNVLSERSFDAQGRCHGLECTRYDDGSIEWQVPWVRGDMHGIARQRDELGRELFRTRFAHGTGIDLWVSGNEIVELREHVDNLLHGIERWGHPSLPYDEGNWIRGKRAGVFRRWVGESLEVGYPRYFVDDDEVQRDIYLLTKKTRRELPPDLRRQDARKRPIHPALQAVWLRKDIRAALMKMPLSSDRIGCGA